MQSQQGMWEKNEWTQNHIKEGKIPFVQDISSEHHIMIQYFAAGGICLNELPDGEENVSCSFPVQVPSFLEVSQILLQQRDTD